VLVRGSPKFGWWQRGGAMAVNDNDRKLHVVQAPEWGEEDRGGWGVELPFL
jgi:hypothetical protein